jgi:hypothetical protein
MRFEDVLDNGKLWAVIYEGKNVDVLTETLSQWFDTDYLRAFFNQNLNDLEKYFHITNVDKAIFDTVSDAASLACVIMDVNPAANLDALFRPLENYRMSEMVLSKEKAKGNRISGHDSWLRLYAIKLDDGIFLITGGAIKLTHTMKERQHTLEELLRVELVRNYLIENGVIDANGLKELIDTI